MSRDARKVEKTLNSFEKIWLLGNVKWSKTSKLITKVHLSSLLNPVLPWLNQTFLRCLALNENCPTLRYEICISFTICYSSLNVYSTLWSITSSSESQDLKFIFCVLIKSSGIITVSCWAVHSDFGRQSKIVFLCVEQFKSLDNFTSGVCWR